MDNTAHDLACPTCAVQSNSTCLLTRIEYGPWPAWLCATCGGMALGQFLAEQVLGGIDDNQIEDVTRDAAGPCAHCGSARRSYLVRGRSVVDRCPSCGMAWIEGDELSAMAALAAQPGGARGLETWFKDAVLGELGPLRLLTGIGQPTESEIIIKILRNLIAGP